MKPSGVDALVAAARGTPPSPCSSWALASAWQRHSDVFENRPRRGVGGNRVMERGRGPSTSGRLTGLDTCAASRRRRPRANLTPGVGRVGGVAGATGPSFALAERRLLRAGWESGVSEGAREPRQGTVHRAVQAGIRGTVPLRVGGLRAFHADPRPETLPRGLCLRQPAAAHLWFDENTATRGLQIKRVFTLARQAGWSSSSRPRSRWG